MIEPAIMRDSLLAKREDRAVSAVHVFDIRLQGDGETVFYDVWRIPVRQGVCGKIRPARCHLGFAAK
jgi:hypothetical protein